MIHARPDYNDPKKLATIPADEPVFLVRGQDQVGAETVRTWARLNREFGGDPALSQLAEEHAEKMQAWPVKKAADLPVPPAAPQTPGQRTSGEPAGDDVLKDALKDTRS